MMKKHVAALLLLCAALFALPVGAMAAVQDTNANGTVAVKLQNNTAELVGYEDSDTNHGVQQIVIYKTSGTLTEPSTYTGITLKNTIDFDSTKDTPDKADNIVVADVNGATAGNIETFINGTGIDGNTRVILTTYKPENVDYFAYFPTYGHFYGWSSEDENWSVSASTANNKQFAGRYGYLATAHGNSAAAEDTLIKNISKKEKRGGYLGGSTINNDGTPGTSGSKTKSDWYWTQDPDYTNANKANFVIIYHNGWDEDEPNNSTGHTKVNGNNTQENRLHIRDSSLTTWNDVSEYANPNHNSSSGNNYQGYFIEFGDNTTSDSSDGGYSVQIVVTNPASGASQTTDIGRYYFGQGINFEFDADEDQYESAGYKFDGWKVTVGGTELTDYSNVLGVDENDSTKLFSVYTSALGNIVMTTKWKPIEYSITYEMNGHGSVAGDFDTFTFGTAKDLPAASNITANTGYEFDGWYLSEADMSDPTKKVTAVNEDLPSNQTFYAKWNLTEYTIEYILNDNNDVSTANNNQTKYKVETPDFSLVDATRSGYQFDGWYTDEACTTPQTSNIGTKNGGNRKYYAQWTANSYTVKYHANGGSSTMADSERQYNDGGSLTANAFARTGYTFAGWAESAEGEVEYDDQATGNLTSDNDAVVNLYAKWTPITYSVVYDTRNVGSATDPGTYDIDDTDNNTITLPVQSALTNLPENCKFTLEGWYLDAAYTNKAGAPGATVKLDADYVANANEQGRFTFYAKWTRTVNVKVVWNDTNNADGLRPAGFSVTVDGTSSALTGDETGTENDLAFTGLKVHDESGNEISYQPTVSSTVSNNEYTPAVTGTNDGYTVTLTHGAETTSLNGSLTWKDNDNQDGKRTAVTVTLYADGVTTGQTATFDKEDGTFTFTGLTKNVTVDGETRAIVYTVQVSGADTVYTPQINVYNIELHYTPGKVAAMISVAFNEGAVANTRPITQLKVKLNDVEHTLEEPSWSKTVADLPQMQNGGQVISYAVTNAETDDIGYDVEIAPASQTYEDAVKNVMAFTVTLTPKTYHLTLDVNGGNALAEGEDKVDHTYGDPNTTLPVPEKPGNDFGGWEVAGQTDPDDETKLLVIKPDENGVVKLPPEFKGNAELNAVWDAQTYQLIFHDRINESVEIEYRYDDPDGYIEMPTPEAPENSGWTFDGWYMDDEACKPENKYEQDTFDKQTYDEATVTNFYARWTKDMGPYTVTWDDNNNQDDKRGSGMYFYLHKPTEEDPAKTEPVLGGTPEQALHFHMPANVDTKNDLMINGVTVHGADGKEIPYTIVPGVDELLDDFGKPAYVVDDTDENAYILMKTMYTKVFSVRVEWVDNNNEWGTRPDSLNVELFADGAFLQPPQPDAEAPDNVPDAPDYIPIEPNTEAALSAGNGWQTSWWVQQNPSIMLLVEPLKYDVKLLTYPGDEYVMSETLTDTEKVITFVHRDLLLPPTGDESNLALWGGLLALCAGGLGALAVMRRKRRA